MNEYNVRRLVTQLPKDELDSILSKLPSGIADEVRAIRSAPQSRHCSPHLNGRRVVKQVSQEEMNKLWR